MQWPKKDILDCVSYMERPLCQLSVEYYTNHIHLKSWQICGLSWAREVTVSQSRPPCSLAMENVYTDLDIYHLNYFKM